MKTHTALFSIVTLAVAGAVALVRGADLQPAIVTNLSGQLHIVQPIPCDGIVNETADVTGGRIELSPAEGVDLAGGAKRFSLTRANINFEGFSASGSCLGFDETDTYGPIRVQLARSITFTALPSGVPGVFNVTIPRLAFELRYATTVDGAVDTGTKIPREDVTGTINLTAGTMQMHVVLGTRVHFRRGCIAGGCVINETHDGTVTADVNGTIQFPDADGDGVPDRSDNCDFTANPKQALVATPTLTPPGPVTLNSCLSQAFGRARALDVCDAKAVTLTHNAPTQFNLGANTVTWHAVDWLGRTADANQTVTIVDTTVPSFTSVPPDLLLNNCGPVTLGTPTATDDCAGIVTFSNNAPAYFQVGVTPVTWTARDVSGNQTNAVQTVTVVDTTPPEVFCPATSPTGSSFTVSAIDACAGAPVIRLGSYVLAQGETIMINITGQPGVRLQNIISEDGIRHFQVGKGEAIINATDASGNVASATCVK